MAKVIYRPLILVVLSAVVLLGASESYAKGRSSGGVRSSYHHLSSHSIGHPHISKRLK